MFVGDRPVSSGEWQAMKSRDLFFFLVCQGPLTKDKIATVFWPDDPPDKIRNNLHSTNYRARRALAPLKDVIIFDDNSYMFNRRLDYTFDVETFEQQLDAARVLTAAETSPAIELYSGATNLYRATGAGMAAVCMVVDVGKGLVPTWLFPGVDGVALPQLALLYGFAAVLGHIFPIWARFRGGKGVATGAGVYIALAPAAAAMVSGSGSSLPRRRGSCRSRRWRLPRCCRPRYG